VVTVTINIEPTSEQLAEILRILGGQRPAAQVAAQPNVPPVPTRNSSEALQGLLHNPSELHGRLLRILAEIAPQQITFPNLADRLGVGRDVLSGSIGALNKRLANEYPGTPRPWEARRGIYGLSNDDAAVVREVLGTRFTE
jgi:hypothetical protein